MYRFLVRPAWLAFHLLVVALVVLMVNLGFWQQRRLDERREFNAEVRARTAEPVAPIEEVVGATGSEADPAEVQWRTVTATGTYLPAEQVVIVNRAQGGTTGVNVVTPMQLTDGRLVLVNRGFVPDALPVPEPPAGEVELTGRLRESQQRSLGGLTEGPGELSELFRIDIERLADQLPGEVVRVYVDLLASEPAEGEVPVPLPDPELSEGSHLSYMVQWWVFSVCVVVGWALAVRRSIGKHRLDVAAASEPISGADARTPPDSPMPADDAATTAPDRTPRSSPG